MLRVSGTTTTSNIRKLSNHSYQIAAQRGFKWRCSQVYFRITFGDSKSNKKNHHNLKCEPVTPIKKRCENDDYEIDLITMTRKPQVSKNGSSIEKDVSIYLADSIKAKLISDFSEGIGKFSKMTKPGEKNHSPSTADVNSNKSSIFIDDINVETKSSPKNTNKAAKKDPKDSVNVEKISPTANTKDKTGSSTTKQDTLKEKPKNIENYTYKVEIFKPESNKDIDEVLIVKKKKAESKDDKQSVYRAKRYGSLNDDIDDANAVRKIIHHNNKKSLEIDHNKANIDDHHGSAGCYHAIHENTNDFEVQQKIRKFDEKLLGNSFFNEYNADFGSSGCYNAVHENEFSKRERDEKLIGIDSTKKEGCKPWEKFQVLQQNQKESKYKERNDYSALFNALNKEAQIDHSDLKKNDELQKEFRKDAKPLKPKSSEDLKDLLKDPENVKILENLLNDIKNEQKSIKERNFRQKTAYEWSKYKVLHPDGLFKKHPDNLSGYFTSLKEFSPYNLKAELFPVIENKKTSSFGKKCKTVLKTFFATVGISFVGLLAVDMIWPEYLKTDDHMGRYRYKLTDDGISKQK